MESSAPQTPTIKQRIRHSYTHAYCTYTHSVLITDCHISHSSFEALVDLFYWQSHSNCLLFFVLFWTGHDKLNSLNKSHGETCDHRPKWFFSFARTSLTADCHVLLHIEDHQPFSEIFSGCWYWHSGQVIKSHQREAFGHSEPPPAGCQSRATQKVCVPINTNLSKGQGSEVTGQRSNDPSTAGHSLYRSAVLSVTWPLVLLAPPPTELSLLGDRSIRITSIRFFFCFHNQTSFKIDLGY